MSNDKETISCVVRLPLLFIKQHPSYILSQCHTSFTLLLWLHVALLQHVGTPNLRHLAHKHTFSGRFKATLMQGQITSATVAHSILWLTNRFEMLLGQSCSKCHRLCLSFFFLFSTSQCALVAALLHKTKGQLKQT